ncbi:MAG TPA: glycosyltransferase family 2 protein, partial [Oligoflexia bacterium]|nr:glycosyltransferase family 2 protein [Oligoflexia bacterium]
MDLSVLLLTLNEEKNVGPIIARAVEELSTLRIVYEIIVVDGGSDDDTVRIARAAGVRVELQREKGYAAALKEGVALAKGQWIITLDVDGSHPPALISALWAKRDAAECAVASRFVPGGSSEAPPLRRMLSKVLSMVYPRFLALPVRDVSSGYRLYRRDVIADLP